MNNETQPKTEDEIKTVETVDLDNVTGGCAACGMANCTMGASPAQAQQTQARAPWFPAFNRR